MSVHGYPADKSIFLLQLEIWLPEVTKRDSWQCRTSNAYTEEDVSLAGVAQSVACSPFFGR